MTFVESNWTYDKLGRVTNQVVQKGPGPAQVVRQDLAYFGNDDPKTLTHNLGTVPKQFQYGYDLRHQLTSATAAAGYFTANYSYGLGGRFTRATEAQTITPLPAGTEVKPRDVNYVYGGTDPEQVTALTNVSNGQTYASYTYDAAGNQLTRTYPSTKESWDYVYDGKDQLRRATKKVNGVVQSSEEYWYDNDGQRIAVVKRNAAGAKTEMIWFIGDTQAHYNGAGAVTHVYSHLSMGTPVARVDRTGNATTAVEYQFHGLASNTIAAVEQGGTDNASFSYAPFGEVVEATEEGAATAGIAAHRRRLNDKYVDEISNLGYYGIRYYDKMLIGWTQADPLYRFTPDAARVEPRRAGLYAFSGNNPLRYIDPDGRDWKDIGQRVPEGMRAVAPVVQQVSQLGPPGRLAGAVVLGVAIGVALGTGAATDPTWGFCGSASPCGWIRYGSPFPKNVEGDPVPSSPIEGSPEPQGGPRSTSTSKEDPPPPETGSPEDIEKDPNKGHPYRERPGPFRDPKINPPIKPHRYPPQIPYRKPKPDAPKTPATPQKKAGQATTSPPPAPHIQPFGCGIECIRAF